MKLLILYKMQFVVLDVTDKSGFLDPNGRALDPVSFCSLCALLPINNRPLEKSLMAL